MNEQKNIDISLHGVEAAAAALQQLNKKIQEQQTALALLRTEFKKWQEDSKGFAQGLGLKNSEKNLLLSQWKDLRDKQKRSSADYYQWEDNMQKQRVMHELQTVNTLIGSAAQLNKALHGSAEFAKVLAIAQATIQTYQNAVMAYSDGLKYGGPILGAIEAAAAVTAGLANVAQIENTKLPGFSEGGYTGRGDAYSIAGFVHGNEYVVPSRLLENASALPLIHSLESMRTGGPVLQQLPATSASAPELDYDLLASKIGSRVARAVNDKQVVFSLKEHDTFVRKVGWK